MLELGPGGIAGCACTKFPAVKASVAGAEDHLDNAVPVNVCDAETANGRNIVRKGYREVGVNGRVRTAFKRK